MQKEEVRSTTVMVKIIVFTLFVIILASCNTLVSVSTEVPIPTETKQVILTSTVSPTFTTVPSKDPNFRSSGINKVSVSPNGSNLVVADLNGVWIYDLSNGKLVEFQEGDPIIDIPAFSTADILWSPNGESVAVTQDKNGVWVWDAKTWELLTEIKGEFSWREVRGNPGFTWSPDGEKLALGTGGGNVSIWDRKTNQWNDLEKRIDAEGTQLGILWAKDNRLTTVLDSKLFDVETGEYITEVPTAIDGIGRITWSPAQTHVYFFFDMGGGFVDLNKEYNWWCCNVFSWSNSGQYFATFAYDTETIYVIDTSANERVFEQQQDGMVYALAWMPENELLSVRFKNSQLVLLNVYTDEIIMNLSQHIIE